MPLAALRAVTGIDRFGAHASCEGADVAGVLELVATGHGLVVVPRARVPASDRLVGVPIAEPRLVHRVELVHGTSPGPSATTLIDALLADGASAGVSP